MLANGRWDLIRRLKGCVKNQQIHQLFIQFINYAWQLLHVSALHCHLLGAFLVPSERCSIEEQSIELCGWVLQQQRQRQRRRRRRQQQQQQQQQQRRRRRQRHYHHHHHHHHHSID